MTPDSAPHAPRARTTAVTTAASLLLLSLLLLLAAGALQARHDYLTRGIPQQLPPPIPHGGAALGLNVYLDPDDDAAMRQTLAQIRQMGVRVVKQPFTFRPDFDWTAAARIVTAVSENDLTLVPLLDGDPGDNFAPPDAGRFAAWAGEFAARHGDQIAAYIIWDEPNLASHWGDRPANPAEYAALLSAAAAAIRAADAGAIIVAAPLAPTTETGPQNLAEPLFLNSLYESGAADAFDVVAVKPYGFDSGPDDRVVRRDTLNFSRAILVREVMQAHGDEETAVWAGNWGWNSLPPGWNGAPSIWGQTNEAQRAAWSVAALQRARQEWPWMGLMFLENWQPDAAPDDPRWGFSIAGRETAAALQDALARHDPAVAMPGFHLADAAHPAQSFEGGWRFSPQFGADISQTPPDAPGDRARFTFWGTDAGLRVRRADYRARLYVTVDGAPANALPQDEKGTALVLTAPDAAFDQLTTEVVAGNLPPGVHTVEIEAERGWEQWALNGFVAGYRPPLAGERLAATAALLLSSFSFLLAIRIGWRAGWGAWGAALQRWYDNRQRREQAVATAVTAVLVALMGWLTWGEQAAGVYRRLGDVNQLALTAAAAAIFYVTPTFFVYLAALLLLFVLLYFRPVWGLALIAFCFPFYVPAQTALGPLLKPIAQYRFSPPEIFTVVTFAAVLASALTQAVGRAQRGETAVSLTGTLRAWRRRWTSADTAVLAFVLAATLSFLFAQRADVAANEWRTVIVEPALFYGMLRLLRPGRREMWMVLDAFVAGAVVVAGYGLWQYLSGSSELITAEGGLLRIRSFYGSPNNVALYLGRVLPLLLAMLLLGGQAHGRRRHVYAALLPLLLLVLLLTFSRGAILLGAPAAFLLVFWQWQRVNGRRTWPWLLALAAAGAAAFVAALQITALAGRLDLGGQTSFFRVNLWRASVNMFWDHPLLGVGPDNFLYAYRGRYILSAAWQEPDLNHPHNIVLDFATRLGLLGTLAGGWMVWECGRRLWAARRRTPAAWRPVAVGLAGGLAHMLLHGVVDHSFFLVDLAFAFFLMLGTAVWLETAVDSP